MATLIYNYVFRWNAIKTEKAKFNKQYPFLFPKSYENLYDVPIILRKHRAENVNCQVGKEIDLGFTQYYLHSPKMQQRKCKQSAKRIFKPAKIFQ